MSKHPDDDRGALRGRDSLAFDGSRSRRRFLVGGGAALAASALLGGCATAPKKAPAAATTGGKPASAKKARITAYRTLGRTKFSASEIALGCGRISDPNLVRYAYDRGVNFFDTAETYGNGDSERMIGTAMPHLQRDKIFLVTKLEVKPADTEQTLLDRFARCLERLETPYIDALYSHSVTELSTVKHAGFHGAFKKLKAAGKVRHAGISSHGPRGKGDPMDKVLLAAIEDGRYDVMLLVYNFIKREEGARVLAAARKKGVDTTLMKTAPARLSLPPFDPKDPAEEYRRMLALFQKRAGSREKAVAMLQKRLAKKRAMLAKHKPEIDAFVQKHGIVSELALRQKSVQWALSNEHAGAVCVSMNDFETMDAFIPLAGTKLAAADARLLDDWAAAYGPEYCRHGCAQCEQRCPHGVSVASVLRYAYYAEQGSERHAMRKYAALDALPADNCVDCDAPCEAACPHGLAVSAELLAAHGRLTLA